MNTLTKNVCLYAHAYSVAIGESAVLYALDHPIEGTNIVRTSTVQSYNPENGRIETLNTIYVKADA